MAAGLKDRLLREDMFARVHQGTAQAHSSDLGQLCCCSQVSGICSVPCVWGKLEPRGDSQEPIPKLGEHCSANTGTDWTENVAEYVTRRHLWQALRTGKILKTGWAGSGRKLFSLLIILFCENELLKSERTLNWSQRGRKWLMGARKLQEYGQTRTPRTLNTNIHHLGYQFLRVSV